MADKIERKYLAHYIDESFGGAETCYTRLGDDLEEYNEELNPDVEVTKNIKGEQSLKHNGYEVQSEVDPYYATEGSKLWDKLAEIANERKTGAACKTTKVDVLLNEDGTVTWAFCEDVAVIPNSIGGDTSGVQIPFTIYNLGNRIKGSFDITAKKFTPDANSVTVNA